MEFCCHQLYQKQIVTCPHLNFHMLFSLLDLLAKVKCGMGAFQAAVWQENPPANAGDAGNTGSILGWGRSPGEGNGNPLQYSCLKNPTDRERSLVGYSPQGCKQLDSTE